MHMQDVFFSTQLAEPTSNEWVGGPPVLLQGTLNDTNTNVIAIMNACASSSPSHCGLSPSQSPSHWPALSSPNQFTLQVACCTKSPAPRAPSSSSPCQEAVVVMLWTNLLMPSINKHCCVQQVASHTGTIVQACVHPSTMNDTSSAS